MIKTRQKEFALSIMKRMKFDEKIIADFKDNDSVWLFEPNVATRIDKNSEEYKEMQELQN